MFLTIYQTSLKTISKIKPNMKKEKKGGVKQGSTCLLVSTKNNTK